MVADGRMIDGSPWNTRRGASKERPSVYDVHRICLGIYFHPRHDRPSYLSVANYENSLDPLQPSRSTRTISPRPPMSHLCLSCSSCIRPLDTHRTPCCASPICASCVARNPRMVGWVPCLRCGDGKEVVKAPRRDVVDDARFVIGDDDDEEEDEDEPPGYEDVANGGDGGRASGPIEHVPITTTTAADATQSFEPLQHRIQRGETIRSIASRYAMDVRHPLPALSNPLLTPTRKATRPD